jgi:hypothetical protein
MCWVWVKVKIERKLNASPAKNDDGRLELELRFGELI